MKRLVLVAALAAVSACSEPATEATEEAAVEEPAAEAATAMAADGGPPYGDFKVTTAEGEVWTEAVSEDGTYTSTSPTGETETGRWVQRGKQYCTTKDEEGATEVCHTESVDANGVWTAVDPEGNTVTVERVAAAE